MATTTAPCQYRSTEGGMPVPDRLPGHIALLLGLRRHMLQEEVEIAVHDDVGRDPNPWEGALAFHQEFVERLKRRAALRQRALMDGRQHTARTDQRHQRREKIGGDDDDLTG